MNHLSILRRDRQTLFICFTLLARSVQLLGVLRIAHFHCAAAAAAPCASIPSAAWTSRSESVFVQYVSRDAHSLRYPKVFLSHQIVNVIFLHRASHRPSLQRPRSCAQGSPKSCPGCFVPISRREPHPASGSHDDFTFCCLVAQVDSALPHALEFSKWTSSFPLPHDWHLRNGSPQSFVRILSVAPIPSTRTLRGLLSTVRWSVTLRASRPIFLRVICTTF